MDEQVDPFNIFQALSVIIWSCEEYELYALCILLMTIFSIVATVRESMRNNDQLKKLTRPPHEISVLCNETWIRKSSEYLLPGDIFALDHHISDIPCDAILLEGEAILDESMLTGN